MPSRRSSGVLLHPTSLPGGFGIGDLGSGALEFIELLASAGQRLWQILPLGPTGFGDSPYQCCSAFAGNPLLISLDRLTEDGLLTETEIERFRALLALVDCVRIDHFRGFEASWEVPGDASIAVRGEWGKGPGVALFDALQSALETDRLPFVAENLGVITPEAEALRERLGLPGMAILQFAFGNDPQAADFKPHNYPRNLVAYTGTHDNDTTVGWWTGADGQSTRSNAEIENERERARCYLNLDGRQVHWEFIRAVLASVADTAIVPAQDLLGLGSEARMNRPGTVGSNWRWRLVPGQLTGDMARKLAMMTETYDRV